MWMDACTTTATRGDACTTISEGARLGPSIEENQGEVHSSNIALTSQQRDMLVTESMRKVEHDEKPQVKSRRGAILQNTLVTESMRKVEHIEKPQVKSRLGAIFDIFFLGKWVLVGAAYMRFEPDAAEASKTNFVEVLTSVALLAALFMTVIFNYLETITELEGLTGWHMVLVNIEVPLVWLATLLYAVSCVSAIQLMVALCQCTTTPEVASYLKQLSWRCVVPLQTFVWADLSTILFFNVYFIRHTDLKPTESITMLAVTLVVSLFFFSFSADVVRLVYDVKIEGKETEADQFLESACALSELDLHLTNEEVQAQLFIYHKIAGEMVNPTQFKHYLLRNTKPGTNFTYLTAKRIEYVFDKHVEEWLRNY